MIRGEETIAFVMLPGDHEFLAGGKGMYWDVDQSPLELDPGRGIAFNSWYNALNFPAGVNHVIILSKDLWKDGRPGSFADGAPDGNWILPRINAGLARTIRSTPWLNRTYLAGLAGTGFEPVPAGTVSMFENYTGALQDWLRLFSTFAHEVFHAGFAADGFESGGPQCDMNRTPVELARRPIPDNNMSFHAAVLTMGAEVAECAVLGTPIGWLGSRTCCQNILDGTADATSYAGASEC